MVTFGVLGFSISRTQFPLDDDSDLLFSTRYRDRILKRILKRNTPRCHGRLTAFAHPYCLQSSSTMSASLQQWRVQHHPQFIWSFSDAFCSPYAPPLKAIFSVNRPTCQTAKSYRGHLVALLHSLSRWQGSRAKRLASAGVVLGQRLLYVAVGGCAEAHPIGFLASVELLSGLLHE